MDNATVQELIEKTFQELNEEEKPQQRSRVSNTPNGYIHLVAWANATLLRIMVRRFTETIPRSEHRLKAQIDDAARSVVANIEEGFGRPTTMEYLTFLGYAQASLIEVKGDIQRSRQDNLLASIPGTSITGLEIDLSACHEALKKSVISRAPLTKTLQTPLKSSKGFYGNLEESKNPYYIYTAVAPPPNHLINAPPVQASYKFLYDPVDNLRGEYLTYEIFIELINKTDWHLRRLVMSLEDKLARDQKFYQVEKAKIRGNTKFQK
ncbi:MAG TPA: four helix bundle protein [Patescibacteria group bacterium]|nr:four helix bundle protein [Patescibacteria group bacterium]